jgi:hypothetical protein
MSLANVIAEASTPKFLWVHITLRELIHAVRPFAKTWRLPKNSATALTKLYCFKGGQTTEPCEW